MIDFRITFEEKSNLLKAIKEYKDEGKNIWTNDTLVKAFKNRLKAHLREKDDNCCYCKRNLIGEFNMVIDLEHVLPKGQNEFRDLIFDPKNINIACKRCNMEIKKARVDFLKSKPELVKSDFENPDHYSLIHPNFENFFEHVGLTVEIKDTKKIIKYYSKKDNGKFDFMYEYFKYKELEIDTVNESQGIKSRDSLSLDIPDKYQDDIKNAFKGI